MRIRAQLLTAFVPLIVIAAGAVGVLALRASYRLTGETEEVVERVFSLRMTAERSLRKMTALLDENRRRDYEYLARQAAATLDLSHRYLRKEAAVLASSSLVASYLEANEAGREMLQPQIVRRLHEMVTQFDLHGICLHDAGGRVLVPSHRDAEAADSLAAESACCDWLRANLDEAARGPRTVLLASPSAVGAAGLSEPMLVMSAPFRRGSGSSDNADAPAVAYLVFRMSLHRFCAPVLEIEGLSRAAMTIESDGAVLFRHAEGAEDRPIERKPGLPSAEIAALDGQIRIRVEALEAPINETAAAITTLMRDAGSQSVRLDRLARTVEHKVLTFRERFAVTIILALLLGLLVSIYLARRLAMPLVSLSASTGRIAGGRLDEPLRTDADDEIGDLARSVDRMRNGLKDSIENLDRKVADKSRALAESEAHFRAVFNQSGVGILLCTPDGRILDSNPALQEMLGYTAGELTERSAREITYPGDWEEEERRIAQMLASGRELGRIVKRYIRKDGETVWVDLTARLLRNEDGSPRMFVVVAANITAQRRVEESLRASEEAYRQLFSEMADGFALHEILTDADGRPVDYRYLAVNPAFARLTGLQESAVVGRTVREALPGVEPMWIETFGRVALTGEPAHIEDYVAALGRWYDVRAYSPARGRFAVVFADVTERRKAEEGKRAMEQQMLQVQKLESLGVLAGGIAHDFNNLLMSILGNADLALSELPPHGSAQESLTDIVRASRRAADLCRQMLAYSGKGRFTVEPVNLNDLIEEMAHLLVVSISKNVRLQCRFADDLPFVEGDATQLRQIVMNLITNASEAVGSGVGSVTLATGVEACTAESFADTVTHERLPDGPYVFVEVADTGCGMSPETLAKIFDPFFTTKFTGRGLGLAAVLGIVRGHKGAIRVRTEPDRGTSFRVLLPMRGGPLPAVPAPAPERVEPPPHIAGTILLVDDEPGVRQVAGRMLTTAGFQVLTAASGAEAIEIVAADPARITCVLLDLTMPQMDGEETLIRMRAIRGDLPVVLSSGYNEQESTQRFAGRDLAGFIQKPYVRAQLIAILRTVTERLAVRPPRT